MFLQLCPAFVTSGSGGLALGMGVCQRYLLDRSRVIGYSVVLRTLAEGATVMEDGSAAEVHRIEVARRRAERRSRRSEAIQRATGRQSVGR